MPDATSDTTFWRLAYEEHGPAILGFLRARLGTTEDAEELMQETFVRAMRSAEGLRDPSSVRSYLFTTAHNLVRNHHRRVKVSPLVGTTLEHEPIDHGSSDARVRLRGLLERLAELLASMPDAHRQAFELGVLDRLPYREIADRTGWSLPQVKINVYRARRRALDGLTDILGGDREVLQ